MHYATLRLEDGVTFTHLFTTDSDDASNTLGGIAAFADFLRDLPQLRRAPGRATGLRRRLVQGVWGLISRTDAWLIGTFSISDAAGSN